jgi:hypothetical protein
MEDTSSQDIVSKKDFSRNAFLDVLTTDSDINIKDIFNQSSSNALSSSGAFAFQNYDLP